jgi:hypothetical protein
MDNVITFKHYTDANGMLYAFNADGSQDSVIFEGLTKIDESKADVIRQQTTDKHHQEYLTGLSVDELAKNAVDKRNMLLTTSDYTQVADAPIKNKEAWAIYRQALRDITSQIGYPKNIIWPIAP